MPYGLPGAHWALLGSQVRLRRGAVRHHGRRRDDRRPAVIPTGSEWAREYVLSHYSDTEALAAFTEIARQQEGQAC